MLRTPTGSCTFFLKAFFRHTSNKRQSILTHVKGTLVQISNAVTSLIAPHLTHITWGFNYLHFVKFSQIKCALRSFVQYFILSFSLFKIALKTLVMTRRNINFRSSVTFSLYWYMYLQCGILRWRPPGFSAYCIFN